MSDDRIDVQFGAQTGELTTGLAGAKAAVAGTTAEMKASFDALKTSIEEAFAPLILLFAAFKSFTMVQETIDKTVELARQLEIGSQKTGMAVEALSRLQYAASQSETSVEALTIGLTRLARGMQEAQIGAGPADAAFKQLGVHATDVNGQLRPMNDVLLDLATKFASLQDGAAKTAIAIALFGRSGADMIPFLNRGKEGIAALEAEADRLGITLGGSDVKAILGYKDAMVTLTAVWDAFLRNLVVAIMPILERLLQFMTALVHVVVAVGYALMAVSDIARGDFANGALRAQQAWESLKKVMGDFTVKPLPETSGTGTAPPAGDSNAKLLREFQSQWETIREGQAQNFGGLTQMELDFWKSKIGLIESGSKEALEIRTRIGGLEIQVAKDAYDAELGMLHAKEQADKDNLAAVVEDRQQELAIIRQHYAEASREVQDGIARLNEAQNALQHQTMKEWVDTIDAIPAAFSAATQGIGKNIFTLRQLFQTFFTDLVKMSAEAGLRTLRDHVVTELAKSKVTRASVLERVALDTWAAVESVAKSAWAAIVNIGNFAAQAIAGAWASISSIPVVGPFLAPVIAAGVGAAVIGLASNVKSASGGYDIPSGLNPMTQLHAQEMVLPADLANRVRSMTDGGGTTVHLHVHAVDGASVKRLFLDHNDAFGDAVVAAVKSGRLKAKLGG